MSNISFMFATIVANEYGYSPHFSYIVKNSVFQPFEVHGTLKDLKKFGGTPTCQKMTIWGTLSSKTFKKDS